MPFLPSSVEDYKKMATLKIFSLYFLFTYLIGIISSESILEKHCTKFEFEEKVLEKLIRLDVKVDNSLEKMELAIEAMKSSQEDTLQQNKAFKENIEMKNKEFTESVTQKLDELDQEVKSGLRTSQLTLQQFMETVNQTVNATIKLLNDKVISLLGDKLKDQAAFVAHTLASKSLKRNAAIVYGTVLLNIGNGYNAATGKFTATVSGTYLFSAQICSKISNYISYQLIVNNVVYSASQQYDKDREGVCSSVTTVAFLTAGQDVWVKCVEGASVISTNAVKYWNMFSGVLVNRALE